MHVPPLLGELLEALPEVSNKMLNYFVCHLDKGRVGAHFFLETFMIQKNITIQQFSAKNHGSGWEPPHLMISTTFFLQKYTLIVGYRQPKSLGSFKVQVLDKSLNISECEKDSGVPLRQWFSTQAILQKQPEGLNIHYMCRGLVALCFHCAARFENHCLKNISRDTGFKKEEKEILKSCTNLFFYFLIYFY